MFMAITGVGQWLRTVPDGLVASDSLCCMGVAAIGHGCVYLVYDVRQIYIASYGKLLAAFCRVPEQSRVEIGV